jgi:hypothetical protein
MPTSFIIATTRPSGIDEPSQRRSSIAIWLPLTITIEL